MSAAKEKNQRDIVNETWGIVFIALGLLVLIAQVADLVQRTENILGPWVGTALAHGLIVIFGTLPAFFLPALILFIGIQKVRDAAIDGRTVLFGGLFVFEVCVLLAITGQPVKLFRPNLVGTVTVYFMQLIFRQHTFGPYFLTCLGMLITVLLAFRVNFTTLVRAVAAWFAGFIGWWRSRARTREEKPARVVNLPAARRVATEPEPAEVRDAAGDEEPPAAEKTKKKEKKPAADDAPETAPADEVPDPEEEAKRLYKEQLARFREKKKQPITISTGEEAPSEPEESAEESDELALMHMQQLQNEPDGVEEPAPIEPPPEAAADVPVEPPPDYYKIAAAEPEAPPKVYKQYIIPPLEILQEANARRKEQPANVDTTEIEANSQTLEKTLLNFAIEGKVVSVSPGPVVTRYEIELAPGIKVSRVVSLQDDISMAVGGQKIRIQAPIPGKAAIGIELPNKNRQIVYFYDILTSELFQKSRARLPIVIGRTVSGAPYISDIAKMPHMLIAGQTGSGKSVAINSFIASLLMTKTPSELRMIMIDPKKVELSYYQGIPHLIAPVVTESREAVKALSWGIGEMDRRYRLLAKVGARNIEKFNEDVQAGKIKDEFLKECDNKPLPYVVIVVDELADLMLTAAKDVEASIQRIAQLARAVGLHLIVATQRPSVDIITGPIKANLTSRMAFRTIQSTDSRTILGYAGAEKLLGQGDMLFLRSGAPDIERFHGSFISEEEVEMVVRAAKQEDIDVRQMNSFISDAERNADSGGNGDADGRDELFEEAARLVVSVGQGSTSLLQRRMKIGYARAGRLMDELHMAGIVGPQEGSKMREVLVKPLELEPLLARLFQ